MKLVEAWYLWALVLAVAVPVTRGIWLNMPSSGTKCVSEELHNKVVVIATYYSFYGDIDNVNGTAAPTISVKVTSPYGNEIHRKEKVAYGNFGFTTTEAGNYLACFWIDDDHRNSNSKVTVGIDWKTGISAKDWDSVAKKEKIEGLDLEMRKLLDSVRAVQENLNYLSHREMEMREVSEATNARVVWFSIMSLGIGIAASVFQILFLRRYFQKKKLIL